MSFMPHNWNNEAVNQYLSLRPSLLSEDEFRQVHQRIDKIQVEYLHTPVVDGEFVTQEVFLDSIITADLEEQTRIIIVEGEVGSGKSHLCTWLRHELGSTPADGQNDRVAVQVTRDNQNLGNVINELSELVDTDTQSTTIDELDPQALAQAVVANLRVFSANQLDSFSQKEIISLTDSRENELDLTDIIEDNIRTYQSDRSSEVNSVLKLIDRNEYRQLRAIAFDESPNDQRFEVLLAKLNDALTNNLGAPDLFDQLRSICDAAIMDGFRPVLICPDISELGVFRDDLLEYAMQLQSDHLDLVVGWPTGWVHEKKRDDKEDFYTYIRQKSEGYFRISDSQGESYFLTKDTAVSLTERYVRAIQSASNEDFTDTVRPESFGGLYPFNAPFVHRLYTHLQQDEVERRTPRLLLRSIRECLLATDPPFETIEQLNYIKSGQEPILRECPPAAARLIKWYGVRRENNIIIPRGVFGIFDVEIPTKIKQNAEIKLTE